MFEFCCRRLQLLVPSISVDSSVTHFQKASPFSTSYSSSLSLGSEIHDTKPEDGKDQSYTVSYLINSFGFSPQLALSLSKKRGVHFNSPERPDSVIKLLKDYGFSDSNVAEIVTKLPTILLFKPEKPLVPKLEFFGSIGITGTNLTRLICRSPSFLNHSIERRLIPCYNIIKTLPVGDRTLGLFMKGWSRMFNVRVLVNAANNVAFLRSLQAPESSIYLYEPNYIFAVSRDTAKFKEYVEKVVSLGFCPSSTTFVRALYVISIMNGRKWSQRIKFCREWGWAEDDPADVAQHPTLPTYSSEKWIIPRWSVIRVLLLKGFITKGQFSLVGTALMGRKDQFLHRFVNKYQEQVPELLSIFQGKIGLAELGLGFEETDGVKQMEYVGRSSVSLSSTTFMRALYVISIMNGTKWSQRWNFTGSGPGWAEDDVLSAFRKSPALMILSEKNVSLKLDFYLNNMGWQPADIARHPTVLTY
ncbi:hypothetical protein ACLB2K_059014 [Fragaria x ananassa]